MIKKKVLKASSYIIADPFFEGRSVRWLTHRKSLQDNPNISVEETNKKIFFIQKWDKLPHLLEPLVNLQKGHILTILPILNSDLFELLSLKKAGVFLFNEGNLIPEQKFNSSPLGLFCSLEKIKSSEEESPITDGNQDIFLFIIKSISILKNQLPGYVAIKIELLADKPEEVKAITCFTPSKSLEDKTYQDVRLFHLLYSIGADGVYN